MALGTKFHDGGERFNCLELKYIVRFPRDCSLCRLACETRDALSAWAQMRRSSFCNIHQHPQTQLVQNAEQEGPTKYSNILHMSLSENRIPSPPVVDHPFPTKTATL